MPGRQSGDNKLGLTPYIVGEILGDGCLYSTVQSAIDDAFAAGGGIVGIRAASVPYVENLTLRAGVDLYGFCVDGRLPSIIGQIVIQGNHTFTQAGGFGAVLAQYITFEALAGDVFTLNATGGGSAILAMKFSGVQAQTVAGQRVVLMNPDAGSSCQFSTDNTNISSDGHCFENIGLGSGSAFLSLGNSNSSSGDVMNISGGGNGSITGQWTSLSGLSVLNSVSGNGSSSFTYSDMFTSAEAFLFGAGGGSAQVTHCQVASIAASGNWIDGPIGSLTFVDVGLSGSALNIGAAITQAKNNWQPYAETAAAAGGSNRGTASFDSASFSVTDGWVQFIGSATFPWIDQGASTTVLSNTGNFTTAVITLTLPAAPAQGDVCKFKQITNDNIVIAANVGQIIQLGNIGGTQAASTSSGDALELTYYAAGAIWMANNSIGNFVIS